MHIIGQRRRTYNRDWKLHSNTETRICQKNLSDFLNSYRALVYLIWSLWFPCWLQWRKRHSRLDSWYCVDSEPHCLTLSLTVRLKTEVPLFSSEPHRLMLRNSIEFCYERPIWRVYRIACNPRICHWLRALHASMCFIFWLDNSWILIDLWWCHRAASWAGQISATFYFKRHIFHAVLECRIVAQVSSVFLCEQDNQWNNDLSA